MATADDTAPTLHSLQGSLPQGSPDCTAPGSMSMHYEAVPTWDHGQSNTLTRLMTFSISVPKISLSSSISPRIPDGHLGQSKDFYMKTFVATASAVGWYARTEAERCRYFHQHRGPYLVTIIGGGSKIDLA